MEVNVSRKNFVPVEMKITFETREEVDEFYTIFNYSPLVTILTLDHGLIRDKLEKYTSNPSTSALHHSLLDHFTKEK